MVNSVLKHKMGKCSRMAGAALHWKSAMPRQFACPRRSREVTQINRTVKRVERMDSGVPVGWGPAWEKRNLAATGLERGGESKTSGDCVVRAASLTLL